MSSSLSQDEIDKLLSDSIPEESTPKIDLGVDSNILNSIDNLNKITQPSSSLDTRIFLYRPPQYKDGNKYICSQCNSIMEQTVLHRGHPRKPILMCHCNRCKYDMPRPIVGKKINNPI